jgi:hypothetical protein
MSSSQEQKQEKKRNERGRGENRGQKETLDITHAKHRTLCGPRHGELIITMVQHPQETWPQVRFSAMHATGRRPSVVKYTQRYPSRVVLRTTWVRNGGSMVYSPINSVHLLGTTHVVDLRAEGPVLQQQYDCRRGR